MAQARGGDRLPLGAGTCLALARDELEREASPDASSRASRTSRAAAAEGQNGPVPVQDQVLARARRGGCYGPMRHPEPVSPSTRAFLPRPTDGIE